MSLETLLQLAVLALIDSTSLGTLVIPLWLMLRRETKGLVSKLWLYLGVLSGFYFLLGIVLLTGGHVLVQNYGQAMRGFFQTPLAHVGALAIAVALLIYGLSGPWNEEEKRKAEEKKAARKVEEARQNAGSGDDADVVASQPEQTVQQGMGKWVSRIDAALRTPGALIALAGVAGLLEVPTMLPYLAASGILVGSGLTLGTQILVLAAYCAVMILPALLLLIARVSLGSRADRWFEKAGKKLGGYAKDSAKWVAAIGGFLLLRWALSGPQGINIGKLFESL